MDGDTIQLILAGTGFAIVATVLIKVELEERRREADSKAFMAKTFREIMTGKIDADGNLVHR